MMSVTHTAGGFLPKSRQISPNSSFYSQFKKVMEEPPQFEANIADDFQYYSTA